MSDIHKDLRECPGTCDPVAREAYELEMDRQSTIARENLSESERMGIIEFFAEIWEITFPRIKRRLILENTRAEMEEARERIV